jgi:hypothetical protein
MLSYYEEVQTHPLNLFQYALIKYFLRCQFIKNISDPAQVLTQGVGAAGGGGMFGDYSIDTTSRRTAEFCMISAETPCWERERK